VSAMTTSRPMKTVDDYMALGDEVRAELIAGEIYVTPSPTPHHQSIAGRLHARLGAALEKGGLGALYFAPLDVHLPSGDIVQPDLLFIREENLGIVQDWIRGVPDLLIEIVSQHAERDRIVKRELYARNGVPEYWLVDGATQTIERLLLAGDGYAPAGYYGVGDVLVTETMPHLELAVGEVFPPRPQ